MADATGRTDVVSSQAQVDDLLESLGFGGKPVVVMPAETESQIQALTDRVSDLEETLTRMNGANETLTLELDQARRMADSQKMRADALESRLTVIEKKAADIEARLDRVEAHLAIERLIADLGRAFDSGPDAGARSCLQPAHRR